MASIKIEVPNDDIEALRAFALALNTIANRRVVQAADEVPVDTPLHHEDGADARGDAEAERQHAHERIAELQAVPKPEAPTGAAGAAEPAAGTGTASGATDTPAATTGETDDNDVQFDPEYCGEATEPFYTTGKMKGQWKKRKGVDQAAYDAWYASQLQSATPPPSPAPAPSMFVDTGAAFGSAPPAPPAAETGAPTDTGAFMGWCADQQVAGNITQADIQDAFAQAGIGMADLFPPNDADTVAANIAKVYAVLSA